MSTALPVSVRRVLPGDTAATWEALAGELPDDLYLGGGTAIAVHLGHRESRDLDLFFHGAVDLEEIRALLRGLGHFAVTHEAPGTLRGLFGATKVEFLDASSFDLLAEPVRIAGLNIARLQDLMAMKLKVLAERGEMRDYYDVRAIDEDGTVSVEDGVGLYMERYRVGVSSDALPHLYRAMGDLSDVEPDELLPVELPVLQRWWSRRQVEALRNASRFG